MYTPTVISAVMALAPPTDLAPPDFGAQLDSVEFIDGGEDVQWVAYDASGEVIGSIALWVDEHGHIYLASDYGDDYAEVVVVDGEATIDATLPPDVTSERAELMLITMEHGGLASEAKPTIRECAKAVAAAAGLCALPGVRIVACPFGIYDAACECSKLTDIDLSPGCLI
jgi:hypothetical protein